MEDIKYSHLLGEQFKFQMVQLQTEFKYSWTNPTTYKTNTGLLLQQARPTPIQLNHFVEKHLMFVKEKLIMIQQLFSMMQVQILQRISYGTLFQHDDQI